MGFCPLLPVFVFSMLPDFHEQFELRFQDRVVLELVYSLGQ